MKNKDIERLAENAVAKCEDLVKALRNHTPENEIQQAMLDDITEDAQHLAAEVKQVEETIKEPRPIPLHWTDDA